MALSASNSSYGDVCAGANRIFKHYLGDPRGSSYRKDLYFTCHSCGKNKLGVNEEKRVAHCFTCGWKGNAVTLIQEIENCTVHEAIVRGTALLGITPPPVVRPSPYTRPNIPTGSMEVFEELKRSIYFAIYYYFHSNNEKSAAYHKRHLLEVAFDDSITQSIDIVVSKPSLNVVDILKKTYPLEAIASCPGFIRVNGEVQFYLDDHILFPYWDPYGRYICAFNGRKKQDSDKGPRYKWLIGERKHLYFPAGVTPSNVVMITEGEKKAITATLMGIPTIGVSGVECFNTEELPMLEPTKRELFICYDHDTENSAVRKAELRLYRTLLDAPIDIQPHIIELPLGYKLDSFLAEHGADALRALMSRA